MKYHDKKYEVLLFNERIDLDGGLLWYKRNTTRDDELLEEKLSLDHTTVALEQYLLLKFQTLCKHTLHSF